MSSNWPVPVSPPIRTPEGVNPAAIDARHEQGASPGTDDREGHWARVLAGLVGFASSAIPLLALVFMAVESGRTDLLTWTERLTALVAASATSAAISIPCFYLAGSNAWRRRPRWARAFLAWPVTVFTFATVILLELGIGQALGAESLSALGLVVLLPLPTLCSIAATLLITGVVIPGGRAPAPTGDLLSPGQPKSP